MLMISEPILRKIIECTFSHGNTYHCNTGIYIPWQIPLVASLRGVPPGAFQLLVFVSPSPLWCAPQWWWHVHRGCSHSTGHVWRHMRMTTEAGHVHLAWYLCQWTLPPPCEDAVGIRWWRRYLSSGNLEAKKAICTVPILRDDFCNIHVVFTVLAHSI